MRGIRGNEKVMLVIGCAVLGLFALRSANAARQLTPEQQQELLNKRRAM